jgi:hypothetical protein
MLLPHTKSLSRSRPSSHISLLFVATPFTCTEIHLAPPSFSTTKFYQDVHLWRGVVVFLLTRLHDHWIPSDDQGNISPWPVSCCSSTLLIVVTRGWFVVGFVKFKLLVHCWVLIFADFCRCPFISYGISLISISLISISLFFKPDEARLKAC